MFFRYATYLFSLLMLVGLAQPSLAATSPQLSRITKEDNLASSRITLDFSAFPEYRMEHSGQRVDLFFANASAAETLRLLPEDDKIVKVLIAKSHRELLVSLLLRQIPANISVAAVESTGSFELELFWKKANSSRPAVAFRISGLPSRQINSGYAQPMIKSKYNGQWQKFFNNYQTPLKMDLPLKVTTPILPRFGFEKASATFEAVLVALEGNDAAGALKLLKNIPSADLSPLGLRTKQLLQAEALLRNDAAAHALAVLEQLPCNELPEKLQQRAGYLHNLALVLSDDPYGAIACYSEARDLIAQSPYRFPLHLLQAEIYLGNGNSEKALDSLLIHNSRWPKSLRPIRKLRIADAQVATGQSQVALSHYQQLAANAMLSNDRLFALHQAALASLENRRFDEAQKLYQRLANLLADTDLKSEALFLSALSIYRGGNHKAAMLQFRLLREDYPNTPGEMRAWLKMLDHGISRIEERYLLQGIRDYPVLSLLTGERPLREEAAFKLGITLHLHGEPLRAIEALGKFCRHFASSSLRSQAEALLAEILPGQLEQLIAKGEDLQAVVLLEKYRELLIRGDGKWPFLPKLAKAFTRLGLFDRGCRVYLYLLDHTWDESKAEVFYLPLASLYFDRDEYVTVEKYCTHYLAKYPKGSDRSELFLLRLRALQSLERYEEAAKLLEDKKLPRNNEIELLAAEIYWELGDYNRVIDFANRLGNRGEAIPPAGLLLEAEALRRLGHGQQALPLYEVLAEDGTFSDQATYRCGQILLARGERRKALNLFQSLADKGESSLWRQLAMDSINAESY